MFSTVWPRELVAHLYSFGGTIWLELGELGEPGRGSCWLRYIHLGDTTGKSWHSFLREARRVPEWGSPKAKLQILS